MTENPNEIVIRHLPYREWIAGGLLTLIAAAVFAWILFSLLISPRPFSATLLGKLYDSAPFLLVVAAFVWLIFEIKLLRAPLRTVRVDSAADCVDLVEQRFYGRKTVRYHFHQLDKFKSYRGKLNFTETYFLAVIMANRRTVKLKVPIGRDKLEITRFVKKLNKLIKSKKPAENS